MLALFVDGMDRLNSTSAIDVSDRGLNYGDGLFETMLLKNGTVRRIDAHLQRLAVGCKRLGIECPSASTLHDEISRACTNVAAGVVKVVLTRGAGARGYRSDPAAAPTRIVSLHPPIAQPVGRLRIRWCEMRLSRNPALAGIKHLNRLEQVLAQNEWHDSDIGEGLMLDSEGELVSATAANLFIVRGGDLVTSDLRYCGIRGVMRAAVLQRAQALGMTVHEEPLWPEDIESASEVFLTNAVRGIRPVTSLDEHGWPIGPITQALQKALDTDA